MKLFAKLGALIALAGGFSAAFADEYIDVLAASPEYYRLLSQEGNVRVIEMRLPAGEADNLHSHHTETVYFVSGGLARITVGDEAMEIEIPDGHVLHHGPWTHRVENIGESEIHAVIFERMPE